MMSGLPSRLCWRRPALPARRCLRVATHQGQGIAAVQAHLATEAANHQRSHADGPLRFVIDRAVFGGR